MNKAPFFISAPRTRSSVLFETAQFYVENVYNLKPLGGHTELFLEYSRNTEFHDVKVDEYYTAELYPIAHKGNLRVHYIYPHVFNTRKERNLHKIQILKDLKNQGHEFNIKGTINIVEGYKDVLNFYSDRHFVLTKRRNIEDYVCSFLVAYITKFFHARPNNLERYTSIMDAGIHVSQEFLNRVPELLTQTIELWNLQEYIQSNNWTYTVTYYEDLDTQENIDTTITNILGTDNWKDYLPENIVNKVPLKINKDYSKIISNYNEIIPHIREYIKESEIELSL